MADQRSDTVRSALMDRGVYTVSIKTAASFRLPWLSSRLKPDGGSAKQRPERGRQPWRAAMLIKTYFVSL